MLSCCENCSISLDLNSILLSECKFHGKPNLSIGVVIR